MGVFELKGDYSLAEITGNAQRLLLREKPLVSTNASPRRIGSFLTIRSIELKEPCG
jgi:hypothetical protein